MVPRAGHVGHVGGDRLDLVHEPVAHPAVVLYLNAVFKNAIKMTSIFYYVVGFYRIEIVSKVSDV